jgi:outer membrane protein assembly factor BamB
VANGLVYVLTGSNTLLSLEADSGKLKWSYNRVDSSSLSVRGGSKPAIKNNQLFVGFSDGAVVSLNAQTGALNWEKTLNRNKRFKDLDSNPVIENDLLYLLGFDDALYCLKASSGDIVWKHAGGGYGSVLLTKDRVLYSTTTEEVLSLDKLTGQVLWSYKLLDGIATSPVLYKGMVAFGESKGALVLLDSGSGKKISEFYPGRGIFSAPSVDEVAQEIYFISNEANLYKMRALWTQRVKY